MEVAWGGRRHLEKVNRSRWLIIGLEHRYRLGNKGWAAELDIKSASFLHLCLAFLSIFFLLA